MMKVDLTTVQFYSTSSYKEFIKYENAMFNKPYIAAIFSAADYGLMKRFILGKCLQYHHINCCGIKYYILNSLHI